MSRDTRVRNDDLALCQWAHDVWGWISRKPLEIEIGSNGPPIGNGPSRVQWSDDVTWPWKVKVVTPIYLVPIISETAGDSDLVTMECLQEMAGPKKTPFLCPRGRVVYARGRVVLSWWTKVNTVISAVFFEFLGHLVSESVLSGCNSCRLVPQIAGCLQLSQLKW